MDLTNKLYKVFLIAGSEPLGTAGMQADIKSISACGGYAAGAITCIVDEDTIKVKSIQTIPVEMVVSQTYSFLEDVGADCIKTGMLYSQELVTAIGDVVKKQSIPIVVDPVMVSSAGDKLLQDDAIQAYKDCLFPYSTIITPNRREADLLLGKSLTKDNMKEYIPELSKWGNCVIVKSIEDGDYLIDVFYNPISKCFKLYKKARIQTKNVNGTGDTFCFFHRNLSGKGIRHEYGCRQGREFHLQCDSLRIECQVRLRIWSGLSVLRKFKQLPERRYPVCSSHTGRTIYSLKDSKADKIYSHKNYNTPYFSTIFKSKGYFLSSLIYFRRTSSIPFSKTSCGKAPCETCGVSPNGMNTRVGRLVMPKAAASSRSLSVLTL